MAAARPVFINLAVRDLPRAKAFFEALGFGFDARFTNDIAACLVLNDQAYAMLLTEPFFAGFTDRALCDTSTHTEALIALMCDKREDVDAMVHKALAHGGAPAKPANDMGFMYGWSFYDPDGHHWEVGWMDMAAAEAAATAG